MFELVLRLTIAAGAVGAALALERPPFDVAWKVGAACAASAWTAFLLDARGWRNSGSSGFVAVWDAACISVWLAASGVLDRLGFLALAPCAYAAARFGSHPAAMAPLAASSLFAAHFWSRPGAEPTATLMAQAAGVLIVGLLFGHRRIVATASTPLTLEPVATDGPPPEAYMDLRDGYRRLRDAYRDLEARSRRNSLQAAIWEVRQSAESRFYERLAEKLRELCGADSAVLYLLCDYSARLVVRATAGERAESEALPTLPFDAESPGGDLRIVAEEAVRAYMPESERARTAGVLLRDKGRVRGLICLKAPDERHASDCQERAEESAPYAAAAISEYAELQAARSRAAKAELLYEIACMAAGATSKLALAERVIAGLSELVEADHASFWWLSEKEAMLASHVGEPWRLLESMRFGKRPGIKGWLSSGAQELAVMDASEDERCPPSWRVKERVRSLALFPVRYADSPAAFVVLGCRRAHAFDASDLEAVRVVAAEASQASARLDGASGSRPELASAGELERLAGAAQEGFVVLLEPLRFGGLIERYGHAAVLHVQRQYALRLLARLPASGRLAKLSEGAFAALLPNADEDGARSWANEAAALASFIALPESHGMSRTPLAYRTRAMPAGEYAANRSRSSA